MEKEKFFEVLSEKLNIDKEELKNRFNQIAEKSKEKHEELQKAIKENNFAKIKEILNEIKEFLKPFENFSILFTEYKNNEDIETLKEWEELKRIVYSMTN